MIRTQIQLTDEQAQALKALSARTGLSIAELVRRGLVPLLRGGLAEHDNRARRAADAVGRFHSGKTDISLDHDRYLADLGSVAVFIDTSAFFAVLDADDANHAAAARIWKGLIEQHEELVCSNYILIEAFALLRRRLGLESARVFQMDVVGVLEVRWVDEPLHAAGVSAMLTAGRRQLSLVDCVSFELMRRLGLTAAFAFDQDFADQGFSCLI